MILVILLFLRDWRSTIVAMVAIPVSIIAAFMVMSFFGASINVLTLLAIVLAIGIVVDDAIVEIENIHRRIEQGQPPLLASFDGAREIGFAVIATTATLMAVFVPSPSCRATRAGSFASSPSRSPRRSSSPASSRAR